MSQTTRRLALASTCLIAALGLIACGGGDDENTTSTTGLGSGASTTTSATDTVATDTVATEKSGDTSTSTVAADDAVSELFFSTIHKTVLKKGLSEEAAQCIEDKLRGTITPEEIAQIKSGQRPESLRAKATDAGTECGAKFGG